MIQTTKIRQQTVVILGLLISILLTATAWAEYLPGQSGQSQDSEYTSKRLLVRFDPNTSIDAANDTLSSVNGTIARSYLTPGLKLIELDGNIAINDAVSLLASDPNIIYAEPDYIVHSAATTPNDTNFNLLWGLHQDSNADIDAPEAWDLSTGSANVVVGVIDSGVDYNHVDLANNMWINPGEIAGNGIDDDGNGWIDDIHGIDTVNNDGDPYDDHHHGTHCAGTIGAQGNNGIGVVGVNWNVSIMALKFLDSSNSGFISNAIICVDYAASMGAHLTSNSWVGGRFSQAMKDSIENADMIFCAAAGNDYGNNNDINPVYPASYTSPQVISVASTDYTDNLSSFSNYGPTSVDVGAPGSNIYSCEPGNSYQYLSGTSMATPHVAGLAALLMAYEPGLMNNPAAVKSRILEGVDVLSSLAGMCVSEGRINAFTSLSSGSGDLTIDIKANASDGPVTIAPGDTLFVRVNLDSGDLLGEDADWWMLAKTPSGWFHFKNKLGWQPGRSFVFQRALFDLDSQRVPNISNMEIGKYTFYFGVDMVMDGFITKGDAYYDNVEVNVTTPTITFETTFGGADNDDGSSVQQTNAGSL